MADDKPKASDTQKILDIQQQHRSFAYHLLQSLLLP